MAVKIAVPRAERAEDLATHIDETEARIRAAVPIARVIYIEPDIFQARQSRADEPASAGPPVTA